MPPGSHHFGAFADEQPDIRDMLDDFHVEDDVEGLAGIGQVLGRRRAVVDRHARLLGMQLGDLDVGLRRVGADNRRAKPGQRLAKQAAAAADVEDAQALERPCGMRIAAEALRHLVADIGQPDRVELVQRAELAVRIPPFGGQRGKAVDFRSVNGRSSCFGHDPGLLFGTRKSGPRAGLSRQQSNAPDDPGLRMAMALRDGEV